MRQIILFAAVFSGATLAAASTTLSKQASTLEVGMGRPEVLALLGKPTWAVLPKDTGNKQIIDSRTKLELHWKNGVCAPVVVQFGKALRVTGWDEGRMFCGSYPPQVLPKQAYSCAKKDRVKYCN